MRKVLTLILIFSVILFSISLMAAEKGRNQLHQKAPKFIEEPQHPDKYIFQ